MYAVQGTHGGVSSRGPLPCGQVYPEIPRRTGRGERIRKCNSARVSMETVYSNKHKTAELEMASTTTETVALALRELAMSPGDQDGLADFLTDYFGRSESDELGK